MRILIRRPGSAWHSPASTAYDNEDALQSLLEQAPELLPWADPNSVVVAREMQVPLTGAVDLVAVSVAGQITIVECKLAANPEIRRRVVGQLVAYAAGIAGLTYDLFDDAFGARTGRSLTTAVSEIAHDLGADWDEDQFRANVKANLAAGRMGLLIAVDEITDELKRIVEFLNAHTVADLPVLALELKLVRDEGIEVLLPSTYGEEAVRAKPNASAATDENSLFAAIGTYLSPDATRAFQRIFNHAQAKGTGFYWGEGQSPSVAAWYTVEGQNIVVWSCFVYTKHRRVTFDANFAYLARREVSPERLDHFLSTLEEIPGVRDRYQDVRASGYHKRPSLSIEQYLTKPGAVDTVLRALDDLID